MAKLMSDYIPGQIIVVGSSKACVDHIHNFGAAAPQDSHRENCAR